MRGILLLVTGSLLASCANVPPAPERTLAKQREYEQLLAGKVAGPPMSCLPTYRSNDMVVIDDHTIAFKDGSRRVYVNNMQGGCTNLGGPYTLVTKSYGSAELCRGDIGQVVDLQSHFSVGSCVFGDFIPYAKPGA